MSNIMYKLVAIKNCPCCSRQLELYVSSGGGTKIGDGYYSVELKAKKIVWDGMKK